MGTPHVVPIRLLPHVLHQPLMMLLFLFMLRDIRFPAHKVDDNDEVHELALVHQVDHKDEHTSHHITLLSRVPYLHLLL